MTKPMYLATDAVITTSKGAIVLVKRKYDPYKGYWCLPGGKVESNETVDDALIREIKEETNGDVQRYKFIDFYSEPNRDPRRRVVALGFLCKVRNEKELNAGDDAAELKILPRHMVQCMDLAFDHNKILNDALFQIDKKHNWKWRFK